MMEPADQLLVQARGLRCDVHIPGGRLLRVVDDVSLDIRCGESYAIVGKSGSGKTSLISILGLLNSRYEGSLIFDGCDMASIGDRRRAMLRASSIGFVFQNYSLIRQLKVWENVALPLRYSRRGSEPKRHRIAMEYLERVGLAERGGEYPRTLSGGEQQRVAIARALVCSPRLLICDEPTGALDKDTGEAVMALLMNLVADDSRTLVLVTHDADVAAMCRHRLHMDRGRVEPCSA